MLSKLARTITSIRFITVVALTLLVASLVAWNVHNTTNESRIFWGMVDNSLSTSAYTRQTTQKSGSQSVEQVIQTRTEPEQKVFSQTLFVQTGVDSATAVTENIGTPGRDYVRYKSIETSSKNQQGKPLDFSKVIGVWGATDESADGTGGQQYGQSVLGLIMIGNLDASQRREMMKTLKDNNAYSFEVVEKKRSLPFGRLVLTYQATVELEQFVTALKQYAAFNGLTQYDSLNPSDYTGQTNTFSVSVDSWSHQITAITQAGGARAETVSGINSKAALPATPKETIPVDVLQNSIQQIN